MKEDRTSIKSSQSVGGSALIKPTDFIKSDAIRLAVELFHEDRPDDAREILREVIADGRDKAEAVLQLASVEIGANRPTEAIRLLIEHGQLFPDSDHLSRARYHGRLSAAYRDLSHLGEDYADKALIECEAAIHHYGKAGLKYDAGCAHNNLALLLADAGRLAEAREHLSSARECFEGMPVKIAEVNQTRAELSFEDAGREREAFSLMVSACATFDSEGETRLLRKAVPALINAAARYAASVRRADDDSLAPVASANRPEESGVHDPEKFVHSRRG
ncbi:MAG: tetratricopeptide repeat protein [Acidobacteriota bacterium]|nr:tetratricopeptide repeat protein [Acidobacteriota bacterium]